MTPDQLLEALRSRGLIVLPGRGQGLRIVRAGWAGDVAPTADELAALKAHRQAIRGRLEEEARRATLGAMRQLCRLPSHIETELGGQLDEAATAYLAGQEDASRLTALIWRAGLLASQAPPGDRLARVLEPINPAPGHRRPS